MTYSVSINHSAPVRYFGHQHKPDDHKHHHSDAGHGDHCDIHGCGCGHDHHDHADSKHASKKSISMGQKIANAFKAVLKWFKELFTGFFKGLKGLFKGSNKQTPSPSS